MDGPTSQQFTCKLNFKNSFLDILKWLQYLQTEFRKSKQLENRNCSMEIWERTQLSTVNFAAPRSVPTQQTIYVVAPTLQLLTIPQQNLFFQTPLDKRGMASLQSNSTFEIWERTSQQLTCKLNFENSFLDILKWLQRLQTAFRKSKQLENRNCSMEIWERTSQQLTLLPLGQFLPSKPYTLQLQHCNC